MTKKFKSDILTCFLFFSFAFPQIQLGADIDGEAAEDFSGWSVSMSSDGSRLAIGAPFNAINGSAFGHVRVYEYANSAWTQLGADIDGEAANNSSGYSVSMSSDGSRLAIGANTNDGNGSYSGHVRVFEYANSAWAQLGADIDGEAAGDQSGSSVSMSSDGSRLAIGATGNDSNSGHVRVYEYASGAWTQLGADIDGEAAVDQSGYSVSMSSDGSRLAIGAYRNDGNGDGSGHVRVYEYANNAWTQLGADIDGEAAEDYSGRSVSMSSDGSRLAIGATGNDGNGSNSGHVRVFEYASGWTQLGADIDGEAAGDQSGYSVSMSSNGSRLAIGANNNAGNGSASGHVRVYEYANSVWTKLGADIDGEASNDYSAQSISMSSDGSRLAIGATSNDGNGDNSGHVRVYLTNPFQPQTKEELQTAVDLWVSDSTTALSTYGEINTWDVSVITDMNTLFQNKGSFNSDISNWNVSNVSTMIGMLRGAVNFNQDISSWNVSKVTTFGATFHNADSFNTDISSWDVSSATNMNNMFQETNNFNQDISGWDISGVTTMNDIFTGAVALSDKNKCAIHTKFSSNENWSYDWSSSCTAKVYVSLFGSDLTGDGTSGNPFYTIQKGINHSKDGDSVLVYAGTYVEHINFTGKKISVIGENKFSTIIDGDSSGTVVTIESGEDSTTLLKGFMIRNGIAKNGGGIKITNKSNPVIEHVIVHDNRSHTNGGGIYINNARASISYTIIRGNNSDGVAGGLYIGEGAEVTVSYAQIINNIAAVRGGGIFIRKDTTSFNLRHALISHNSSYEGGGIGSWYASSNLSNITFVGNNSTTNRGHAIFLRDGAQMVLENSIVMGTESDVIYLEDPESSLSATYSMIEKGWEGEGNIIADPLFCNLEIGNHISQINNYSLWENSPCLGTGKDGANMGAFDMRCDSPKPFEWISSAVDTINLTKSNLNEIYKLEWEKSNNQFGDVNYKVYASVGSLPYDEIHDTTETNFPISYQEFYAGVFESFPTVSAATVKFSVVAIEGTDTIKVTGDDRVVYVNRYDYLSTASHNIPEKFELHDNYPNPFNPTTTIRFDTPEVSNVNLTIYNMLGQKIRSFNIDGISPGSHSITWNATNDYGDTVGAGVYLYHLRANQYVKTKKMILLK